jgi:hypothetical protein
MDNYFIKSENVTDHHFVLGNVNQKKLDVKDYIHFYAVNEKKKDYIQIDKLLKIGKLYPKAFLALTVGKNTKELVDKLKEGEFTVAEFPIDLVVFENYCTFYDYIVDRRITPYHMFRNVEFLKAFRWMCLTNGFEFDHFMKKIAESWVELKPQRTVENWYRLLLKIYNRFGQGKKIEGDFLDDIL